MAFRHGGGGATPPPFHLAFLLLLTPPGLGAGGLLLSGCTPRTTSARGDTPASATPSGDALAPGVIHRALPMADGGGVDVIDVDLNKADARLSVQTRGITRSGGAVVGQVYAPREWLTRTNALAAVNGGYFGGEDGQGRKEFVGLLIQKGRVRHVAPPLHGSGSATIRRGQYVRSAFGVTADGTPSIVWAATEPGQTQAIRTYGGPMGRVGSSWHVAEAVGCGPTLIAGGKVVVTQYQERLVSPGPVPRTFVAYDDVGGRPRHLIFGIASGATFRDLAAFLAAYFLRYDSTPAQAAMCVDGGASTQLSYRLNGAVQSPRETGVTVPDALVLLPRR